MALFLTTLGGGSSLVEGRTIAFEAVLLDGPREDDRRWCAIVVLAQAIQNHIAEENLKSTVDQGPACN